MFDWNSVHILLFAISHLGNKLGGWLAHFIYNAMNLQQYCKAALSIYDHMAVMMNIIHKARLHACCCQRYSLVQ